MKSLILAVAASCALGAASVGTAFADDLAYRVTPDATGGKNGQAWADGEGDDGPMTIEEAMAAANAIDGATVMVKAGTYLLTAGLTISKGMTIRGGMAGTDDMTRDAQGRLSLFDGNRTVNCVVDTAENLKNLVRIENCEMTRGVQRGFFKRSSSGKVELVGCRFTENGLYWFPANNGNSGRGVYLAGPSTYNSGSALISNCVFAGNCAIKNEASTSSPGVGPGCALCVGNVTRVEIYNTDFVTNGVLATRTGVYGYETPGVAISAGAGLKKCVNCRFIGNRASHKATDNKGNASCVSVSGGTALFDHCLWMGNVINSYSESAIKGGYPATVYVSGSSTKPVFNGCTFAFNLTDGKLGSGGILASAAKVAVSNSVFYGNRVSQAMETERGMDLAVLSGTGTITAGYSLFESGDGVYDAVGGKISLGTGVQYGDPQFVTDAAEFDALITYDATAKTTDITHDDETMATILGFDVHVASGGSPAIDKGDPEADYEREPLPNGDRLNLGFYGNTPEAHVTESSQPEVDGDVEVTFPYGTTQPEVGFTLGGEGEYSATARILVSTNGQDFAEASVLENLVNGQTVDKILFVAFETGGELTVKVVLSTSGAADAPKSTTVALTNPKPASYGKGGGEGVVHLWPGATGDGSGSDWFNALTDVTWLRTAVGEHQPREIWIAGSNVCDKAATIIEPTARIAVRGGFTGVECSAAERQPGSRSVIDGVDAYVPFRLQNAATAPVEIERVRFINSSAQGLYKTGAGNVLVRDCEFANNSKYLDSASQYGSGAYLVGTAGTTEIVVSNCVFSGNSFVSGTNDGRYYPSGLGLCVRNAKRATIDDSLFMANATPLAFAGRKVYTQGLCGAAFCALDTPVTVRRSAFRANRGVSTCTWGGTADRTYLQGGTVTLKGACGGSAFTNCLWAGNSSEAGSIFQWQNNTSGQGAMVVFMDSREAAVDFENCTFTGNLIDAGTSPCCVNVWQGTARIGNSIFSGNIIGNYAEEGLGREIATGTNGVVTVDWTIFDHPAEESVSAAEGGSFTLGDHITVAAANLVTLPETMASIVITNLVSVRDLIRYDPAQAESVLPAINAHLRGRHGYVDETTGEKVTDYKSPKSPALDAGDPESEYRNEPKPSGSRRNLGFYGNTPWATMSPGGLMLLVK